MVGTRGTIIQFMEDTCVLHDYRDLGAKLVGKVGDFVVAYTYLVRDNRHLVVGD